MQTQLRKIGNSLGVILKKELLEEAGLTGEVEVSATKNSIVITSSRRRPNFNKSTWDKQFKDAIKKNGPEKSIWPDHMSEEGDKEITWPGYTP